MSWIYATIGVPMWDFYEYGQSVMFYENRGPWTAGRPPMTDQEELDLQKHLNYQIKRNIWTK